MQAFSGKRGLCALLCLVLSVAVSGCSAGEFVEVASVPAVRGNGVNFRRVECVPSLDGGGVAFLTTKGTLGCCDWKTGDVRWTMQAEQQFTIKDFGVSRDGLRLVTIETGPREEMELEASDVVVSEPAFGQASVANSQSPRQSGADRYPFPEEMRRLHDALVRHRYSTHVRPTRLRIIGVDSGRVLRVLGGPVVRGWVGVLWADTDGIIVMFNSDNAIKCSFLYGLDPESGAIRWKRALWNLVISKIALDQHNRLLAQQWAGFSLWEADTGQFVAGNREIPFYPAGVRKDGSRVLGLWVWTVPEGTNRYVLAEVTIGEERPLQELVELPRRRRGAYDVAMSADERFVAVTSDEWGRKRRVYVYDIEDPADVKLVASIKCKVIPSDMDWSSAGQLVFGDSHLIRIWEPGTP